MKLYSASMPAPNPRRVRIFAAEKGIELTEVMLDLRARDHKADLHFERNTLGQVPVLELDDSTMISETVSICRYLEALYPDPPLFGRTPLAIALVDMWVRRSESQIGEPVRMFWRHAHPATASLLEQHKTFGEANRAIVTRAMRWLDDEIGDQRAFIAGEAFSIADITTLAMVDFAALIGLDPLTGNDNVTAWHQRVSARPSVCSSAAAKSSPVNGSIVAAPVALNPA